MDSIFELWHAFLQKKNIPFVSLSTSDGDYPGVAIVGINNQGIYIEYPELTQRANVTWWTIVHEKISIHKVKKLEWLRG